MQKYAKEPMSFEELVDFKTLYKSHLIARRTKRHKKEVIEFENNLAMNLRNLEIQLKNNTYRIGKYKKFYIYEPKQREIQALSYRDRVIQHSVCDNFIIPYFSKTFIKSNCACQQNKGTHYARMLLKRYMVDFYKKHKQKGYYLKCDIKKYFANIDHDILKQKLNKIEDKRILALLYSLIDSFNYQTNVGLPIGNQTSQLFGIMFLSDIDHYVKEQLKIKYYVRYMDDLIIIHDSRKYLRKCLKQLKEKLIQINLQFNDKTQIYALKSGIEFLGVRYRYSENGKIYDKLKQQSRHRFLKNVKRLKFYAKNDLISREQLTNSLAGLSGHIKHLKFNFQYKKLLYEIGKYKTGIKIY